MSMVHVVAVITAKPGMREQILEAFKANVPNVHAEDGCIEYGATVDTDGVGSWQAEFGADTVVIIEKWESLDHLKAHARSPHMAEYGAKTKDLIADRKVHILSPGLSAMADRGSGYLSGAYGLEGSAATIGFYDEWAASYEAEIRENGYATPARCAAALAAQAVNLNAPLLDLGCGTGLSGEAFLAAGFTTIDGTDFSPEMLAFARAKPGLYRTLTVGDLTNPIPAEPGAYAQIAAVGVISPGHAPADMIGQVLALLPAGGHFVFSLNDHALEDPSFRSHIAAALEAGSAELVFEHYGDHLPGIDLKAMVFVLRRP